jgi:hypothetical protein
MKAQQLTEKILEIELQVLHKNEEPTNLSYPKDLKQVKSNLLQPLDQAMEIIQWEELILNSA